MRFAYADPPYPGQSKRHYGDHPDYAGEVDHMALAERLREYDGWVLHTSAPACFYVQQCLAATGELPMEPGTWRGGTYREMAWVKPFAAFKRNVSVAYAFEPVLVKPLRKPVVSGRVVMRDFIECGDPEIDELLASLEGAVRESITMKRGLTGAKPENVCHWAFEMAGAERDDEMHDLFPGSGAVTRAWQSWRAQLGLAA